ncbi:hypothetical protein SAMN05421757_101308 [Tropicimonas sediminicola]|uniref:Uncharacterized protein n=1 Tax=Tropicimonas sediminicola TaxID=1031541 RepID=A0A239CI47_9RHOB|nr:hypothetical protein SAMN05421757_101308 [Tropicimonas sediminicola]
MPDSMPHRSPTVVLPPNAPGLCHGLELHASPLQTKSESHR